MVAHSNSKFYTGDFVMRLLRKMADNDRHYRNNTEQQKVKI